MRRLPAIAPLCAALLHAAPAAASSSGWHTVEGAHIRLVTAGGADAAGRLKGALEVQLKPGWKTYWRDPGDSGVPPTIDVGGSENVAAAELEFPAPGRHETGGSEWVGYDHSVSFPVTFTLSDAQADAWVSAAVFLGICESICVPVGAKLAFDPSADPDNGEDAAAVAAAFDALPEPERPDFKARLVSATPPKLLVEAVVPAGTGSAELFLAGEHGYVFDKPVPTARDGKLLFEVPMLDHPAGAPVDGGLHYTLATDGGAVSGVLSLR